MKLFSSCLLWYSVTIQGLRNNTININSDSLSLALNLITPEQYKLNAVLICQCAQSFVLEHCNSFL